MMTRRGIKAGVVIETLLILAGVALLAKAAMTGTATYKLVSDAQFSEGTIAGLGPYHLSIDVQCSLQEGEIIFRQDGIFFNRAIGEQIPVMYNPLRPQMAAVNEPLALWFDTYSPIVVAGFLLLFGFRLRARRSI